MYNTTVYYSKDASPELFLNLKKKTLFIFDQDGTLYLGNRPFDFAVGFINRLREAGKRVLFFTNNASHNPVYYVDKLSRLGFSPQDGELMTSGDVTIQFLLRHRPGKTVYLVGTPQLEKQFSEAGIILTDDADIVVSSFDTTLTYKKLETACRLIRGGAEYLSTHPDFNCPTEDGFIPDSGAISAFITASTGVTPTYFGKPYKETLEMIIEQTGVSKDKMCIFGDRLYTDIALGRRFGVTSCLVYTGETTPKDVEKASPADRPDYVFPSLFEADEVIFG
ncbi:MAG: HAD-IIA family hydrolase [Clostridiales bacterium]|nr:HAD-IIA family hydrolase [Clostridiales bacterium]